MNKAKKKKMIFSATVLLLLVLVIVGISSCTCNREPFEDAVRLGQDDLKNGNYKQAAFHLKRAAKLSPDNYVILINLGMAYFSGEEYSSAANAFERAALINPTEEVLEALAVTRLKQDMYGEAINAYTQAITEYGRKPNLIAGIAVCQHRQGNTKYAFDLLQEALSEDSKNPVALYNMAVLKYETNDIVAAANYFITFFEVVDVVNNQEQLNQARARFAEITSKYPEENKHLAQAHYTNAVNLYKQDDLVGAFKETIKAARINPTEPTFVALLIGISKKVGRTDNIQRLNTRLKNGFPEYLENLRNK